MALILKNDLTSFPEREFLFNDMIDSQNLRGTITSFVTGASSKLGGDVWEECLSQMNAYIPILDMRASVADDINISIVSARGQMTNFMEDYDRLDSGSLQGIQTCLNTVIKELDSLSIKRKDYVRENQVDNSAFSYLTYQVGEFRAQYYELKKLCDKLAELEPTDNAVYEGVLSSNKLNSYKNQIK